MNLNHTLDTHHKQFPHWLAAQRDGQVWEAQNPYTCPIAQYMQTQYKGVHIAVWKDSIWIGGDTILFQPQHRFRRLLLLIMLSNEREVSKAKLIEWVKHIWRSDLSRDEKFDVEKFRQHRREVAKQQRAEWGW